MAGQIEPAVGNLLATAISQAVRTPLHSLLGFLELLGTIELNAEAGPWYARPAPAGRPCYWPATASPPSSRC
jgi:signal transduction histidine kinase